jgi:hypothetical protein
VEAGSNTSTVTLRRKGKSQIWDRKIWSRVPRDSDPRKTTLARASSIYKRQTRPIAREGAAQKQDRNCQRVINIWSWAPDGPDTKTYWLTDRQSQSDFDFDLSWVSRRQPAKMWAWKHRNRGMELRNKNYWAQFSGVESLAVKKKKRLYVCCSTAIFGVCSLLRLL